MGNIVTCLLSGKIIFIYVTSALCAAHLSAPVPLRPPFLKTFFWLANFQQPTEEQHPVLALPTACALFTVLIVIWTSYIWLQSHFSSRQSQSELRLAQPRFKLQDQLKSAIRDNYIIKPQYKPRNETQLLRKLQLELPDWHRRLKVKQSSRAVYFTAANQHFNQAENELLSLSCAAVCRAETSAEWIFTDRRAYRRSPAAPSSSYRLSRKRYSSLRIQIQTAGTFKKPHSGHQTEQETSGSYSRTAAELEGITRKV